MFLLRSNCFFLFFFLGRYYHSHQPNTPPNNCTEAQIIWFSSQKVTAVVTPQLAHKSLCHLICPVISHESNILLSLIVHAFLRTYHYDKWPFKTSMKSTHIAWKFKLVLKKSHSAVGRGAWQEGEGCTLHCRIYVICMWVGVYGIVSMCIWYMWVAFALLTVSHLPLMKLHIRIVALLWNIAKAIVG